jgi:RNA polymerase sigma-70 factor (ECF subfamily)
MSDIPTRATLLFRIRDPQDDSAWQEFAQLYTPLILQYCRRRGLQNADAQDVTQDVMRSVSKAIQNFEYDQDRGLFRQWLYTVIRSKLNTFFSRNARKPLPSGDTAVHDLLDKNEADQPDEIWEQEYRRHLIRAALEIIRPDIEARTFDAFWRTTMEEQEVAVVAETLDLSPAAIYTAKYRIVQRLKVVLSEISGESDLVVAS